MQARNALLEEARRQRAHQLDAARGVVPLSRAYQQLSELLLAWQHTVSRVRCDQMRRNVLMIYTAVAPAGQRSVARAPFFLLRVADEAEVVRLLGRRRRAAAARAGQVQARWAQASQASVP